MRSSSYSSNNNNDNGLTNTTTQYVLPLNATTGSTVSVNELIPVWTQTTSSSTNSYWYSSNTGNETHDSQQSTNSQSQSSWSSVTALIPGGNWTLTTTDSEYVTTYTETVSVTPVYNGDIVPPMYHDIYTYTEGTDESEIGNTTTLPTTTVGSGTGASKAITAVESTTNSETETDEDDDYDYVTPMEYWQPQPVTDTKTTTYTKTTDESENGNTTTWTTTTVVTEVVVTDAYGSKQTTTTTTTTTRSVQYGQGGINRECLPMPSCPPMTHCDYRPWRCDYFAEGTPEIAIKSESVVEFDQEVDDPKPLFVPEDDTVLENCGVDDTEPTEDEIEGTVTTQPQTAVPITGTTGPK